ncbi:hypothetical protein YPPY66_2432 [Yersinia pestis PY-66]|uniref:Transposase n=2 Tax=Yersinia pestis TaxID=632 RepID=A0AAV3B449_YERPE|nr:conserved hypothetical protein [Yersinia pestis Angola]EDR30449.1 conserved hypothetical protein [Yersinia pestis biovar Orientalis str. IP275]EDR39268.1 conserved hypothetical protein [Yersinia pestis biovar Orientalis str. F1991016]EDR42575.1 conserved hypothetical protein [Yersinia pestis biovar Antiqua str. E1979001]EDR52218.1 conserved hypothetical protein [Yersinia pestis biovar Antiqua str. B42003004]EDR57681.1 conserved hypothetical protein [Yersinia pestis biovar Orientalis str. MG
MDFSRLQNNDGALEQTQSTITVRKVRFNNTNSPIWYYCGCLFDHGKIRRNEKRMIDTK